VIDNAAADIAAEMDPVIQVVADIPDVAVRIVVPTHLRGNNAFDPDAKLIDIGLSEMGKLIGLRRTLVKIKSSLVHLVRNVYIKILDDVVKFNSVEAWTKLELLAWIACGQLSKAPSIFKVRKAICLKKF
jgi:hypothetical protein